MESVCDSFKDAMKSMTDMQRKKASKGIIGKKVKVFGTVYNVQSRGIDGAMVNLSNPGAEGVIDWIYVSDVNEYSAMKLNRGDKLIVSGNIDSECKVGLSLTYIGIEAEEIITVD